MAMWIDLLEKYMIGNTEYSILAHADWLIFFHMVLLSVTQYGPSKVGIAAKIVVTTIVSGSATDTSTVVHQSNLPDFFPMKVYRLLPLPNLKSL